MQVFLEIRMARCLPATLPLWSGSGAAAAQGEGQRQGLEDVARAVLARRAEKTTGSGRGRGNKETKTPTEPFQALPPLEYAKRTPIPSVQVIFFPFQ